MNYVYVLAVFAGRSVTLLSTLALAYKLNQHEFGIYALASTNALLIQLIAGTWLSMSATKLLSEDDEKKRTEARSKITLMAISIVTSEVLLGLVIILVAGRGVDATLVALTIGWATMLLWFELTLAFENAQRNAGAYAGLSVRRSVLGLALAMGLVLAGYGAAGAIVGQIAGTAISILSYRDIGNIRSGIKPALMTRGELSSMFSFGIVSAIAMGLYMEINGIGRNLIALFISESDAGHFSLASDFFYGPMTLLATSYSLSKLPGLFRHASSASPVEQRMLVVPVLETTCYFALPYLAGGMAIGQEVALAVMPGASRVAIAKLAQPAIVQAALLTLLYTQTTVLMALHRIKALVAIICGFLIVGAGLIGLTVMSGNVTLVLWASCLATAFAEAAIIIFYRQDVVMSFPLWQCGRIAAASLIVFVVAKAVTLVVHLPILVMIFGSGIGILTYLALTVRWKLVDVVEVFPKFMAQRMA